MCLSHFGLFFKSWKKKKGLPPPNHFDPHTSVFLPFFSSLAHLPNQKKKRIESWNPHTYALYPTFPFYSLARKTTTNTCNKYDFLFLEQREPFLFFKQSQIMFFSSLPQKMKNKFLRNTLGIDFDHLLFIHFNSFIDVFFLPWFLCIS
jgi:hypothetical protein